jgi:hypothetical protein
MTEQRHELEQWLARKLSIYLADAGKDASRIGFIEYLDYETRMLESCHAGKMEQFDAGPEMTPRIVFRQPITPPTPEARTDWLVMAQVAPTRRGSGEARDS